MGNLRSSKRNLLASGELRCRVCPRNYGANRLAGDQLLRFGMERGYLQEKNHLAPCPQDI